MASWIAAGSVTPGWYSTVACSVARLTAARDTPGTALKPCSILATQEAHDMPSMATVRGTGFAVEAVIPPPWRGRARVGGPSLRIGIIVTGCAGAWPMPLGPPLRTASGSFSKVRLQPGAQKYDL